MDKIVIYIISMIVGYMTYNMKALKSKHTKRNSIISNVRGTKNIVNMYNCKLEEIQKKRLIKFKLNIVTAKTIIIGSVIVYIIMILIIYSIIQVKSTAIISALPIFALPYVIMQILIDREKKNIMEALPSYIVNLKNYVEQDNNIIKAIKNTNTNEPLKKYLDDFIIAVDRGINISSSFKMLKENVDIKKFSSFVTAIESCNVNGGKFSKTLDKYVDMISKENINRERTKEKAYSSVVILGVMIVINIYLVFSFVFAIPEYSQIIKETVIGRILLDFNAISIMMIGYIISRIYRMGE